MDELFETADAFLKARGYTRHAPTDFDPDYVLANYYRIPRDVSVPSCLTNDKPPQFHVRISRVANFQNARIGIKNEAPQGWVDFAFYSVNLGDLSLEIERLEKALLTAWSSLFGLPVTQNNEQTASRSKQT